MAGHLVWDQGGVPPLAGLPRQKNKAAWSAFFYAMAYYIYILKSLKDSRFYIGSTHDIEKRLAYHNAGLQRSTRSRIPFILVYSEVFDEKSDALRRELQIKSYKGGEAFKKLINGV
jgi:putative endonuclease